MATPQRRDDHRVEPPPASALAMDLQGRLRNVPLAPYRALVPLFEAIANSIDAIRERGVKPGRIEVEMIRVGGQLELQESGQPREELSGFAIRDDGIGFNDANYTSFCTADSLKKLKLGGRGVGRLTWLKVFNAVEISSAYRGPNGSVWVRKFPFSAREGIPADTAHESVDQAEGTVIRLEGIKTEFRKAIPKTLRTIGARIVDHFLVSLRPGVADVILRDGDDAFNVTAEVAEILRTAEQSNVEIDGTRFTLTHVRVSSPEVRAHRVAFLGGGREVRSDSLSTYLPQLNGRLTGEDGRGFWSLTLVESELLDASVTFDRSGFTFPDDDDGGLFGAAWTLKKIRQGVLGVIKEHLEPYLGPIRRRAREEAQRYVEERAPEYRSVLKYRADEVADLPTELGAEKLDLELRKIAFRMEVTQREEGQRLMAEGVSDAAAYEKFVSEVNETAMSNLAKYVIQRRVILNLFKSALRIGESGKHELESAVHKIIFPLQRDSEEVAYEQTNLWIIDEKLAYHAYLASDKQLRSLKNIESDSQQRPDLVVFNRPIAFVADGPPYNSVVIVEFKRPARNEYTDKENPITQIYRYVTDVRAGKVNDHEGRPIQIGLAVPFFAYVVCDITPKLREMATFAQLRQTWDGQGFFGFNENLGVYVEVVSFDKLVDDAERRNRVFFEKLRLK